MDVETGNLAMKRMVCCLMIAVCSSASAQDYAYHPPIAAAHSAPLADDGPHCNTSIRFSEFTGQKVVFQPKTSEFRKYGYQSYFLGKLDGPSPSYDELAGQVATVESIGLKDNIGFQNVQLRLDKTGQIVASRALSEQLSDITLLADILDARTKWVGKILWYRGDHVRNSQDVHSYDGTKILKYRSVKVLDVIAGSDDALDFVVQMPSGTPVLIGVRVSASNFSSDLIDSFRKMHRRVCTFDEIFDVVDPRTTHKWPPAIWSAIELGEVRVGMTIEQATMAWGDPDAINETQTAGGYHAQWVYGEGRYLYIDANNRVSALQQ